MAKLNQIIAIENGEKTRAVRELTDAYHKLQKGALMTGIARAYTPYEENGETLPPEHTRVQVNAADVLGEIAEGLTKLFDVTATKDWANCKALADVIVDGVTVLKQVPVTYLLFLEKKLVDIHTFVSKLPLLDAAEMWNWSKDQNCWVSQPTETARTKKIKSKVVLAEATDKHPAQVQLFDEDVRVGTWRTLKYSGAMQATHVKGLVLKVEALQAAIKHARENANMTEAPDQKVGKAIFDFLFK